MLWISTALAASVRVTVLHGDEPLHSWLDGDPCAAETTPMAFVHQDVAHTARAICTGQTLGAELIRWTWDEVGPTTTITQVQGSPQGATLPPALWRHGGEPLSIRVERVPMPDSIEALSWLEGCWTTPSGDGIYRECWEPVGLTVSGTGHHEIHRRSTLAERLVLRDDAGTAVYVATPAGAEPTPFRATKVEENHAVFENPDHDFPKVIEYERVGDVLTAHVTADGSGFTLIMTRE